MPWVRIRKGKQRLPCEQAMQMNHNYLFNNYL
jgi:hypothetical protein